jgi:hypothetical protein
MPKKSQSWTVINVVKNRLFKTVIVEEKRNQCTYMVKWAFTVKGRASSLR